MGLIADREKANILRVGKSLTFSVLDGGAGGTVVGIVVPCDTGTLGTMLDSTEAMGVVHPALKLTVPGDRAISVNDVFAWEGVDHWLWKIFVNRVANEVVSKTVVANSSGDI